MLCIGYDMARGNFAKEMEKIKIHKKSALRRAQGTIKAYSSTIEGWSVGVQSV